MRYILIKDGKNMKIAKLERGTKNVYVVQGSVGNESFGKLLADFLNKQADDDK